jgi:hypothetical protein
MSILFDAVERRGDIGRRVAALVLPISNRSRVTSCCARKFGLREPGEHASGPNLASRDNVAHNQTLYTILETPPSVIQLCRKQARTYAIRWSNLIGVPRILAQSCRLAKIGPHPPYEESSSGDTSRQTIRARLRARASDTYSMHIQELGPTLLSMTHPCDDVT